MKKPQDSAEQRWRARVLAWRASKKTADAFASEHGFAVGTLKWWASRLRRSEAPAIVQLVAQPPPPVPPPTPPELVVEVGAARMRVAAGFDPALLAEVVRALGATR